MSISATKDEFLVKMMRAIAFHPETSGYGLENEMKKIEKLINKKNREKGIKKREKENGIRIYRNKIVRKIAQYDLLKKGEEVIVVKPGPRTAQKYALNFWGIMFALEIGAINPKDAAKIRQESKAQAPNPPQPQQSDVFKHRVGEDLFDFFEFPQEVMDRIEKLKTHVRKFSKTTNEIMTRARLEGHEGEFFRAVEREYSAELYSELKKINWHHAREYVGYLYHRRMNEYLSNFPARAFDGDKKAIDLLAQSFERDSYSQQWIQTAIYPYIASVTQEHDPKLSQAFIKYSKMSPDKHTKMFRTAFAEKLREFRRAKKLAKKASKKALKKISKT